MTDKANIIFTGGSGLLGTELKKIRPDFDFPSSNLFDVTNYDQMRSYLESNPCHTCVHAAAFTSPPKIDENPLRAAEVNILGSANMVKLCITFDCRLLYISTDYVFPGDQGNYMELDPVNPVNKYAWSKLGGECAVRLYDKSLIVRTSFGPDVFPYDKAFIDQWTSREPVSIIAGKISSLVDSEMTGIVHVGGRKQTVFEYAKSLNQEKEIGGLSIQDVGFLVPQDTSLNCDRYRERMRHGRNSLGE
jgi:dTDP-4-dehydrorhamnose reductase